MHLLRKNLILLMLGSKCIINQHYNYHPVVKILFFPTKMRYCFCLGQTFIYFSLKTYEP